MEKKAAESLIKDTFNAKFNLEQYTLFMRNLLNDYDEDKEREWAQGNYIYESFREHINRFKRLGIYTDPEGNEVELLVIETKATSKLERARTSLRNFVIKRLNDKNRDYALAAFYSKEDNGEDWRFSYIKIEHESYKDPKGKVKTKKELTPAKRFSFLVGEHEHAYTAQKQLLPVLQNDYSNPNIEDLETCFSIEKVTDEFFEQYKELYLKLSEHFSNDKSVQKILTTSGIDSNRFTKKLLGQIVFLYFLQKKGWLGVPKNEPWGKGEKKFMQALYDEAIIEKQNFFKDYLQYLFYEALAKARSNSPDPSYYKRFDCKIPFLNGGLFEADYDWQNVNLTIPNNLFRNDEKNKAGDKGTGILDVFDRYNFTIKEDEPLEKEVAVDPEMLGKVFENMLEITERKSKGAFYTPREIVHYMCQESLINYLDNAVNDATDSYQAIDTDQLGMFEGAADKKGQTKIQIPHKGKVLVPKEDIELFVHKGFLATENDLIILEKGKETSTYRFQLPEAVRTNADLLDEKLTHIKICDPAIGSGAFPVGLLHELVTAQKVLLPYLSETYLNKKLQEIDLDKAEFKKDPTKYIYRVKRHAIQESIYGVDIDASAIDIARLRLWLSLIVDEEDFYSIEALPNLDYKVVRGNSLIGLPHQGTDRYPQIKEELEILKARFFNETDDKTKKELRRKINEKIRQVLITAEDFEGYKIDFDFKLFFSEVWHYQNGFDIVIGNPPYLSYYGRRRTLLSKEQENYFRYNYDCIIDKKKTGKFNSVMFFQEKALRISNNHAIQAYIIDVSFFENFYEGIKKILLDQTSILQIIKGLSSFENVASGQLIVISSKKKLPYKTKWFDTGFGSYNEVNQDIWLNEKSHYQFYLPKNDIVSEILRVVENKSTLINDLFPFKLIRTGESVGVQEKGFVYDEVGFKTNKEIYKYLEGGKSLKGQYEPLIPTRYFIYDTELLDKKNEAYRKEALKNNRSNPKVLGIGDKLAFDNPKILVRQSSPNICGSYTDRKYVYNRSYYSISQINSSGKSNFSLLYTLAFLNSSVINFYAINTGLIKIEKGKQPQIRLEDFKKVPIIKEAKCATIIENLVRIILFLKEQNEDLLSKYFILLVDGMILELYFPELIKSVNKELIKHLINIREINNSMTKEKKLAIIQSEFARLYDPNHPVRNNIETLDSVEEVRIIKEALK